MLTYSEITRFLWGRVRSSCKVGGEWCYRGAEKEQSKPFSWNRFHLCLMLEVHEHRKRT